MCNEALPKHIDEVSEWKGTDHDNWMFRWFIPLKLKYLCFGPRDSHKWHKWREWPHTLFAIRSKGLWRFEDDKDEHSGGWLEDRVLINRSFPGYYLSRIQKWCDWSFQLQWPLFIAAHLKIKDKVLYFYLGAHRDADKVYWIPSVFIGTVWK